MRRARRRRRGVAASVVAMMVVLVACDTEPDRSKPDLAAVETFAEGMWAGTVGRYAELSGATSAASAYRTGMFDRVSYVARQRHLAETAQVRFDAESAAACVTAVRAAVTLWELQDVRFSPAGPCRRVLQGQVQEGGACGSSADCRPTHYCDHVNYACPGTCVPRVGAHETCTVAERFAECTYGTGCFGPSSTPGGFPPMTGWTCQPNTLDVGASCGAGVGMCRPGLYCASDGASLACAVAPGAGESCSWVCAPGLTCQAGTCHPPRRLGETCAARECQPGAYCDDRGVCTPQPTEGQACGHTSASGEYVQCLVGACSGAPGTCSSVRDPGASCASGEVCKYSGLCDPARASCADLCS